MKDIVTINEFKEWAEHFKMYDPKEPRIEIERYGKSRIGRLLLIRKATNAVNKKEYEYVFCTTREYPIATIKDTFKKLQ